MREQNSALSGNGVYSRWLPWASAGMFVLVHLVLIAENLRAPNQPLGDVTYTYPLWIAEAMTTGEWPGLNAVGVYPFLALIPMTIGAYGLGLWFGLCVAINGIAWLVVTRRSPIAGIAWMVFLLLVGPIALGRIDVVTVALTLIAVTIIERHPRTAGIVIAVATWVKVWPVVLGLASLLAGRGWAVARWAIMSALAIGAIGIAWGNPAAVFSFLGSQQGRGVQIEAVAATPWLWDAWAGGASRVVFSPEIFTFEVIGPGSAAIAASLTFVAALALGLVALAVVRSHVRRREQSIGFPFAATVAVLVSTLVVVNKVGSPQFVSWYAIAVVALIVWFDSKWSPILLIGIGVIAVLTHALYPYAYFDFVVLQFWPLVLITVRNAVEVLVLALSVVAMIRSLRVEQSAK